MMMMMWILPQLDSYKAEILMEILTQYIWSFHSSERPKWEEILKNLEILGELRLCHHHTIKVLRYANWNMWFQKALCKLFVFFPIINDHEAPPLPMLNCGNSPSCWDLGPWEAPLEDKGVHSLGADQALPLEAHTLVPLELHAQVNARGTWASRISHEPST